MDELRTVREAYGDPAPPAMTKIARARALWEEKPPRRSRFGWPFRVGLGAVAAGAAVAVAVALTGHGTPDGGARTGPGGRGVLDLDEQAVLQAAAKAELAPTGRYWSSDHILGQSYIVRAKTGTYAITGALTESFTWAGAEKGTGEGYADRDLPARPITPQDEAAWRRSGSPAALRVWSGDKWLTFPTGATKAARWRADGPERGGDAGGGGDFLGESVEELQNLPSDPAELAQRFLTPAQMGKALRLRARGAVKSPPGGWALIRIARVAALLNAPVPPKVRAGLIRALAAQPGIHAIGRVTDPLGRQGVALAADERAVKVTGEYGGPAAERGTYRSREVIVFDERTGALLSRQNQLTVPGGPYAEMKPGFIIDYSAVRSARWTDTKPAPPARLPFPSR
ncbi:hypothetical protein [Actinomadura montaniterrae]|uniref:CU044_5270 family protein n=1 Tax=Actinomadura montaniterrae TaxID=1803903 RepID=A0A6L3VH86_9ACTN|nr:hypothetical protein [Actinomadura montaniterrae]KAB2363165.1 hypothetical protein F9B16_43500 [Actinomadura montaniterrae]